MSAFDDELRAELSDLRTRGLLREPADGSIRGQRTQWLDVSSNDYLGFAREPVSRETLLELADGLAGAGASRLIHGTHPAQLALEDRLARWVGLEKALVFSSGYAANVGAVTALAGDGDLIVSDRLNHASIIDGCRLSRATTVVVPHCDAGAVEAALRQPARRRFVITETYFSMDGDSPELPSLRSLCDAAGAYLFVDEAHALGVFGPKGAGYSAAGNVCPDVLVGTLGKAVGVQGAFVAGSAELVATLWNRARSFVFSTGVSPLLCALVDSRLGAIQAADDRRDRLHRSVAQLAPLLHAEEARLPGARHGPLFPVLLGDNDAARRAAAHLQCEGILVQAIRPPTVPANTSRLRLSLHAGLSEPDLVVLAKAVGEACRLTALPRCAE